MKQNHDLDNPFRPIGEQACDIIRTFLVEKNLTYTGGCRAFYRPDEWAARGERYGQGAELVVVHDGGDLAMLFNSPGFDHMRIELANRLDAVGLYLEPLTGWATAVYKG